MLKQDMIRRLIRYALVGGLVAALQTSLIWYFYTVVGLGARTSFWAGYFPAVVLHFSLTKWWTFRCARRDLLRQLSQYGLVAATGVSIQFGIYHLLLQHTAAKPVAAYLIAVALSTSVTFILMRTRVFPAEEPRPASVENG
jgi:putative flippase GtrA